MKLVKTASGNQVKMSKSEWKAIGKTANWLSSHENGEEFDLIGKAIVYIESHDYQLAVNLLSRAETFLEDRGDNHPALASVKELRENILNVKATADELGNILIEKLREIQESVRVQE